jgi:long-chain fatty acid transport protein
LTSIQNYARLRGKYLIKGGAMKSQWLHGWKGVFLFVLSTVFIFTESALGAGFALTEQSVSGLGNAFAGGAASAEDASTIFFNPAGLTRLSGQQVLAGAHIVIPYAKFHNEGSTCITGGPLFGGNGGNSGEIRVIPNFYYSRKVTDRFSVGLGVNSPFGLATRYDDNWVGRYHAIESDLFTININPSLAYKVTDKLSVGAGFNIQYLNAELTNAVDFGTIGFLLHVPGLTPQNNDGFVKLKGDSWSVGYNLGLLYEFTKDTRAGVAYRSAIEQDLDGNADFTGVPAALKSSFADSKAKADITLPDSLSLSFFHQISSEWAVMADFTWTDWKHFKNLIVTFSSKQPASITSENWQDSYRYSFGATYTPSKNWVFRVGTAYDRSAVPDKEHRTPRIPDSDRIWAAFGVGYKISNMFAFDLGYAHLFVNDPEIDKTPTGQDQLRGGLKGFFDTHTDIVSAQLSMKF